MEQAQERSDDEQPIFVGYNPAIKSAKRPREERDGDEDVPDLSEYLAGFRINKKQQIALCRTYANHLAAALRSTEQD